jgi:hypothetical protein
MPFGPACRAAQKSGGLCSALDTIGASWAPIWVKQGIDAWMVAAKVEDGRLLRSLSKSGKLIGDELGDWAIWSVVEQSAKEIGIQRVGVHNLRRTCAKLCRRNGGDSEQIKPPRKGLAISTGLLTKHPCEMGTGK